MMLPNLKNIQLIGTSIGENMGELLEAFRLPKIRSLELPYNGIEQHYLTAYFKHMFDFDKL